MLSTHRGEWTAVCRYTSHRVGMGYGDEDKCLGVWNLEAHRQNSKMQMQTCIYDCVYIIGIYI